jgi:hypothetical protein
VAAIIGLPLKAVLSQNRTCKKKNCQNTPQGMTAAPLKNLLLLHKKSAPIFGDIHEDFNTTRNKG